MPLGLIRAQALNIHYIIFGREEEDAIAARREAKAMADISHIDARDDDIPRSPPRRGAMMMPA